MQAEAAIPEDILDQQHIQDVDAIDADSMQYVGEGDIDGYAAVEPEADIILAAQKFSTSDGNREEEDGYRRHNNTNGSEQNKTSQKRNENVRRNARKRNKILGSGTDNGDDNNNNKFDKIYTGQMDELDELHHIDEEPFALPSTQEEENFQLTAYPKEQQKLKLIGKEKNDDKGLGSGMTGQHRRFIEKFVGEKCNKALKQTANSDDTMKNNKDNNNDEDDGDIDDDAADADDDDAVADKQSQSSKINAVNKGNNLNEQINNNSEMEYTDDNQAEEKAIGDIEDKFRNEDENATPQLQQEMLALTSMQNKNDEDDRKSVKFIAKKIKRHEKIQSTSFAYVDDAADKNTKNYHYNNNKHTYKRHHYGELHDEIEKAVNPQAKSDSAEKVAMPKNQQLPQNIRHIDEVADSSSSSSGDEMGLQADYSITYFGILANSSKKRDKTLAEDPAEMKELQSNSSENSAKTTEDVLKIADSDGAAKVEEVHATRNQRQQQKQQDSAPDEIYAVSESYPPHFLAFERYKAQRRNSRRYGHKMYKKKYKDYLSYATISSLTAGAMGTAIEATTTTTRVPPGVPGEPGVSLSAVVNATATSAKHTINSTQTKLTNNSYTDYYNTPELVQKRRQDEGQQQQQQHRTIDAARAQKHAEKLRKYARKIEAEKSRGLPASPIFVVGNRSGDSMRSTANTKPFYEGQINYYLETRDEEDMGGYGEDKENADTVLAREREERLRAHGRSMERMIAADNNNWYRRVSPVLRNGIKALSNEGKHQHEDTADSQPLAIYKHQNYSHEQQQLEHQHQHQRIHHHQRNHYQQHHPHPHQHQHQHQHHRTHQHSHTHQHHDTHQHRRGSSNHHKHRQHGKHYQPTDTHQLQQQQQQHHQSNAYQRKLPASALNPPSPHASATQAAIELGMVQTPIPPPSYTKQHQQQGGIGANGNGVQQLGHQITELEEFERYYAKWPHLARVQFQVYDEHYREAHPELYPELKDGTGADDADDDDDEDADEDYDDDYESAAELEEAQSGRDEDANLPPYIKKYNRRNKQLLNLLEGTLPPPTRTSPALMRSWSSSILQPGPHASSRSAGGGGMGRVRIDDDYLKEKRKRYHNRDISSTSSSSSLISGSSNNNRKEALQHYQDLFAQQRPPATTSSNIESVSKTAAVSANIEAVSTNQKAHNDADEASSAHDKVAQSTNQLPDEDVSISTDTDIDAYAADDGDVDIWPKEIENKSNANELAGNEQMAWQIEKLTTPNSLHDSHTTTVTPNAPKAAIFRLPSYPAIAGSFIGKPRSRSAQFAPSGGSRGKLAFVAPVVGDLHGNRWSNMYGRGGGSIGSFSDGSSSNGLGMAGNHHKSLSRFSAYKPTVHKTLTAAAGLTATSTTAPSYLWYAADEGLDTNNLATTTTAATVTPSGDGGDGEDAADAEGGAANAGVARTISSFVYHRVIDASPRLVGTGATVRKQRLPFVAITDRRLETTKKALLERQKDFEQNHYPMP